jgi:hypothetical protein
MAEIVSYGKNCTKEKPKQLLDGKNCAENNRRHVLGGV